MRDHRRSIPARLAPLIAALVVLAACGGDRPRPGDGTPPQPNAALRQLFATDQAARSGPIDTVDMEALGRQDSLNRKRVREIAAAGALRTAADFYRAVIVFQHGRGSLAFAQVHTWALRSEAIDPSDMAARWLVAAAWDRYQMSRGQPQWYGTQTTRAGGMGPVKLYLLDTTRVTDKERVRAE